MNDTPIIWADNDFIESAESGDVVGNVRWLGVEYNVIKVVRTWQGNINKYTWTHYWLDKNLHVYDFIKNNIDWGEATDEEVNNMISKTFLILPAPGGLGTTFHNALIATEGYDIFMHPQFVLGDMGAHGFSFNNGNNGWPDLKTWNALDFKSLPETPFDKNLYHYWVNPPMVSGVLYGLLSKDVSIRTVDIKRATAPTWQNGFEYHLNYVFMRRFFGLFKNGIDYTKTVFSEGDYDNYEDFEREFSLWLPLSDWLEDFDEYQKELWKIILLSNLAGFLWPILKEIKEKTISTTLDGDQVKALAPYYILANLLLFSLYFIEAEVEGVNPNLFGLIRPKVRVEDYPELTPVESPPKNDPLFYGMGY